MKALFPRSERKSKTSVAIAFAAHAILFAGLAAITFHIRLDIFFNRPAPVPEPVIRYVRIAPQPPRPGGGAAVGGPAIANRRTNALMAPSSIPIAIPKPAAPTAIVGASPLSPGHAPDPARLGRGVELGIPDSRISLNPLGQGRMPKTEGQLADSALSAIYDMYLDSVRFAQAHPGRAPGDWTWGGKDGPKWGWDPSGIHLGGITIPNAVLAALPLNIGPTGSSMNALTDNRADAYMRADIQVHANVMSEDEFRAAVKRIRERVDKERAERMARARRDTTPQ